MVMKNKSILISILLILSMNLTFAQKGGFSFSFNINSMWGDWKPAGEIIKGSYDDLVIVESKYTHPSDYIARITVDDFSLVKGSNYKNRVKNNQWYEFTGTIEYFEFDDDSYQNEWCTTLEERMKANIGFGFGSATAYDKNKIGFRSIKKNAIIKIAPYKERPIIYNIYFDNYGIAIDLTPPFGDY